MDIKPFINCHSEQLINELGFHLSDPLPSEVRCVEITVRRESLPWVPFLLSYSDRFRGPTKTIKAPKLLGNITHFFDPSIYIDRESQVVECFNREEKGIDGESWEELQKKFQSEDLVIAQWIRDCWKQANISEAIKHAYCFDEDGWFKPIDLISGEHIIHRDIVNKIFDG